MPAEKFYLNDQVQGDGNEPDVTVSWGTTESPQVLVNDLPIDRSGLNRLIASLKRGRNQVYGKDE